VRKTVWTRKALPDALRRIKARLRRSSLAEPAVGLHDPRVVKTSQTALPGGGFLGKDDRFCRNLSFGWGCTIGSGSRHGHEIITEAFFRSFCRGGYPPFLPEGQSSKARIWGVLRGCGFLNMVEGHQAQSTIVSTLPLKQGVDITRCGPCSEGDAYEVGT